MEQGTFLHKKSIFLKNIDIQQPNSFVLSNIPFYRISWIIYIIVNYPNKFSVIIFFLHGHRDFSRNIIWSKFVFHLVNVSWAFLERSYISSAWSLKIVSWSISLWIRILIILFISVRLEYGHDSAYWIKIELWSVFTTLDTLLVSGTFHKIRCYTIW